MRIIVGKTNNKAVDMLDRESNILYKLSDFKSYIIDNMAII